MGTRREILSKSSLLNPHIISYLCKRFTSKCLKQSIHKFQKTSREAAMQTPQ